MSLEKKTKIIQDTEYTVRLLNTDDGIDVLNILTSIIAPIYAAKMDQEEFLTDTFYSEVAAHILLKLKEVDIKAAIKKLLYDVSINSAKLSFSGNTACEYNEYFSGKYKLLLEVLAFAIKENFPDFFSPVSAGLEGLKTQLFSETKQEK